jgi:hypothetical protein
VIRFAWLQFRAQAAVAAAALAALAACALTVHRSDGSLRIWLGALVIVVPGLIGMFWGAPLAAREFEEGTFRLAWTQSVPRVRWLAVKLGVAGLASMAAAGLFSLAVTWWSGPLDRAAANQFGTFDQRGIVPVGYAAFAFSLGVLAGFLLRRTLPAMMVTLAVFTAARLAVFTWVRPRLISPVTLNLPLNPASTGYGQEGTLSVLFSSPGLMPAAPDLPNTWITSLRVVNAHGGGLSTAALDGACPGIGHGRGGGGGGGGGAGGGLGYRQAPQSVVTRLQDCVAKIGASYHEVVAYQPASRYWPLQWYELAIFLAAALILAAACLWRARCAAAPGPLGWRAVFTARGLVRAGRWPGR